jgi:hypothetical protein
MSKQNFEKVLRRELAALNDRIDERIMRGQSYGVEARRHKMIMSQLASIRRASRSGSGWFTRTLGMVTSFVL